MQKIEVKLSGRARDILGKMRETKDELYKYTGSKKIMTMFNKSEVIIPSAVLDELFSKELIKVYDASAFETWYDLTPLGKTLNID